MKKAKFNFEDIDLSRWHILTYDELLRVNGGSGNDSDDSDDEAVESESEETSDEGVESATESTPSESGSSSEGGTSASNSGDEEESGGHEIENTVEAVANAEVGDTLTRDDGTQVTITQGDIDWAQEHCDSYGKGNSEEAENKEGDLTTKEDEENSDSSLENESNSAKDGENSEKSSGENKDTKTDYASNLPSDYKNYPDFPDYSEERAYINSRLDTPKGNNVAGTIVDLLNKTSTCTGVAGELAAEAAKTNLIDAPVLNEFAGNMSKLGNAVIIVDFAYTSYQNTKAYQNGEMSYWQSAYNTYTHGISVTAGAAAGSFVFEAGTSATFGFGAIPSAIGGVAASAVTSAGFDRLFDKLEEKIWGEAK